MCGGVGEEGERPLIWKVIVGLVSHWNSQMRASKQSTICGDLRFPLSSQRHWPSPSDPGPKGAISSNCSHNDSHLPLMCQVLNTVSFFIHSFIRSFNKPTMEEALSCPFTDRELGLVCRVEPRSEPVISYLLFPRGRLPSGVLSRLVAHVVQTSSSITWANRQSQL